VQENLFKQLQEMFSKNIKNRISIEHKRKERCKELNMESKQLKQKHFTLNENAKVKREQC
jgi:hypothetical protein